MSLNGQPPADGWRPGQHLNAAVADLSDLKVRDEARHWLHKAADHVAYNRYDDADSAMGCANALLAELMQRRRERGAP